MVVKYFPQQPAIKISNGCKTFKSAGLFAQTENVTVLQNYNMNVPIGSLYSLLGSSACGKTTLVSLVVGAKKLTSGKLEVFGKDNGSTSNTRHKIGYMPQETCLYQHFSIFETLMYFGTLFGLSKETDGKKCIIKRIDYLSKLLSLPPDSRIVGTLSGGQQRRVSLAVALVHEPKILILDEPTSGIDPLIRDLIWKHLKYLAATKGTTILLTTHYVQEAKDSDFVGIMRNGRMVAEDNPTKLMERYNANSMEALFLSLCKEQETTTPSLPTHQLDKPHSGCQLMKIKPSSSELNGQIRRGEDIQNSLRRVRALVDKNFKSLSRNIGMLLFITLVPAINMFVTCTTFQNEPRGISLGFVNEDIARGAQCPSRSLETFCQTEHLSCAFIDAFPAGVINLKQYNTIEYARQAAMQGHIWGFMHFPQNYTSGLMDRVLLPAEAFQEEEELEYWNSSKITVRLDRTNTLMYESILTTLYATLERSSKNILRDCGYDERIGEYSLQYKEPIVGQTKMTVLNYVGPSIILLTVHFFSTTVALRFIDEKRQGTMERSIVGGAKISEILIGYAVTEFAILLLQSVLVLCVLHFGFSLLDHPSNLPLILVQCILQGLSGLAMGFLIAAMCTVEAEAAIAIIAIGVSNLILSGLLWPREGMPRFLQVISNIFPMALPAEAIRSLITRGWGLDHPNVWPGICVTVIYIFGTAFIAASIFRRSHQN